MKQFSVVSDIETGVPLVIMVKDGRNISAYGINAFGKEIISSSFKDGKFISSDGLSKSPYRPMNDKIKAIFESAIENAESKNVISGEMPNFGKVFSERVKTSAVGEKIEAMTTPISAVSSKSAFVLFKAKKFINLSKKSSLLSFIKTNKIRFNAKTSRFSSFGSKVTADKIHGFAPGSISARIGREVAGLDSAISSSKRIERRVKSIAEEMPKPKMSRIDSAIISKSRRF